ncbi:MAG: lantibiotic dehydratase [Saprospiraceae bacterium]
MQLFPHILSRVAGLPINQLAVFRLTFQEVWVQLAHSKRNCHNAKNTLLTEIKQFAADSAHYQLKAYLRNLAKDIYNDRRVKFAKIEKLSLNENEKNALAAWINQYQKLEDFRREIDFYQTRFIQNYQAQLIQLRSKFKTALAQPSFQQGLLFASHSTFNRLQSYLNKPIEQHRKKELQTELSLWQYYSRVLTKTSPFSHFTRLSIANFSEDQKGKAKLSLNNLVLAHFQELLQKEPSFFPFLNLRLNPSLEITPTYFIFILNTRNIESIQEMERTDLLDFFYEHLVQKTNLGTFQGLTLELVEVLEADQETIQQFLLQLISYGFLEWDWNISGTDPNYLSHFIAKLLSLKPLPIAKELHQVLSDLEKKSTNFSSLDLAARKQLQNDAYENLKAFSAKLKARLPTLEAQEGNSFQQFEVTDFFLRKEQIFYEDVSVETFNTIEQESLKELLTPLKKLLLKSTKYFEGKMKIAIQDFFKTLELPAGEISLRTFYRLFYQKNALKDLVGHTIFAIAESTWESSFEKFLHHEEDGSIQIDLAYVAASTGAEPPLPMGALIQSFEADGEWKIVLNASFLGFHKYFGRFFHLFSPKFVAAARTWNQAKHSSPKLLVENRDASYYNANVHPPLVEWEISAQGSHQNLPVSQQISIADVVVRATKEGLPKLIHLPTGKELFILDFGFEATENRSAMYQLLNGFGPARYSHLPLLAILNARLIKKADNGMVTYPQICLGKRLVLQRKAWHIPKNILPLMKPASDRADYFLALQSWRQQHNFPTEVFVKILAQETTKNAPKPQYIDFNNPFLVQLFAKMLTQVKDYLLLEVALPAPSALFSKTEDQYCKEFLVEFS